MSRSRGGSGDEHEQAGLSENRHDPGNEQLAVYDADLALILAEEQERDEAQAAMMMAALNAVFSVRKPRDVVAGTSSGLKTISKGVGLGLAALVAQPYLGAKHNGIKGFAKGVGAGLATCTATTVLGTAIGTGQIVRGVMNTPRAIVQKTRGQVWNSEKRQWQVDWYSLPEEAAIVLSEGKSENAGEDQEDASGSSARKPRGTSKKVCDRTLYDVLEVEPDATDKVIRKAFYKKSLALHPDKNPDNPEATAKFQAVSDAYRVLGDEDRRRAYDEHGQDSAAAGLSKIEPVVFFAALFGSHHFEPFIGRLRFAQEIDGDLQSLWRDAASCVDEDAEGHDIDPLKMSRAHKQLKRVELHRQVKCAVDLAARLDPMVAAAGEGAGAQWETEQTAKVAELAKVPCGIEMLYLIGWIYANRARQFFAGSMLSRMVAQVEGSMHLVQSKAQMAGSLGKTVYTVNGVMKSTEKKKLAAAAASSGKDGAADEGQDSAAAADASLDGSGCCASGGASSPEAEGKEGKEGKNRWRERFFTGPKASKDKDKEKDKEKEKEERPAKESKESADKEEQTSKEASKTPEPGTAPDLPPGSLVILSGLTNAAELNNEIGVVLCFDADAGRYMVQIMPDGGMKKLRRENLVLLEAPDGSGAASSSGATPRGTEEETQYNMPGDDDMAAFRDCMPLFHDACWVATKLDVEFTLDKVVMRVLKDMSVPKDYRRRRAEALLRLGTLMQEPMRERRRLHKERSTPSPKASLSFEPSDTAPPSPSSAASSSTTKRKSLLERMKPKVFASSDEAKTRKNKAIEEKQKRLEAALAMMTAGASTEDVDEMIAARQAMEAEDASFLS